MTHHAINSLGSGDTHTHTHTHTHAHTHADIRTETILRKQLGTGLHAWFKNHCKHEYFYVSC